MRLGIFVGHVVLVLLLGVLFSASIMVAFVAGEVFAIAAIEASEGRSPYKWLWRGYDP